ncbi:MAG: putative toxin-antitoxin system toxin component, PIN family [Omnitrophica WOR_2 bacterium GWC2_45_7]|nr:MAG: putative toxin-antitoxin system toxin component, PIN family [Omnitrophica WOR_2 bacterium GWC2_45_7]
MVRVVVDTNVLISAALKGGSPRKIWNKFLEGEIILVFSMSMLEEVAKTLRKSKFADLISEEETKRILIFLELFGEFIEPTVHVTACRDNADNHILAAALSARTDFLVTGDKDLLSLKTFPSTAIIPPAEFLKLLT